MYSLIDACVFPLPKLSSGFVDTADVAVLTGVLSDERANKPAATSTLGVSRVQIWSRERYHVNTELGAIK